jgi:hypothetical protein
MMNAKLVLTLSMFGLAMAFATVFVIPANFEPAFWFPIFLICAYVIARRTDQRFANGLLLGLTNSIWITAVHILFAGRYVIAHPSEAELMKSLPLTDSPRLMMALTGPFVGIISGLVIGLFAVIAGKLMKSPRTAVKP